MRSRSLTWSVLLIAACASGGTPASEDELVAKARGIHERVLTIDTHDDIPAQFGTANYNACNELNRQVDIPKMRRGGLDVAFFIVFVGQGDRTPEGNEQAKQAALTKFNGIHALAEQQCPDQIQIAYTADEVERIAKTGKLVTVIGIENGWVIGRDLSLIKRYYDLGGRYMTLAHTTHNDIADSSNPPQPEHNGITDFGEQVVAEMNRVGMMVDVSHISKAAMLEAIKVSKAPVIGSHSSTRAFADVPRNMDDEQLLALKANGGVVQIVAYPGYVKVPAPERQTAINALRTEFGIPTGRGGGGGGRGGGGGGRGGNPLDSLSAPRRAEYDRRLAEIEARFPAPNVQDFVNHIDHAVKLIGIDHVGISSDFDGGGGVQGWNNAAETFNVTLELVRRGYTEEQIAKIWGGNLLRVWREVDRVAKRLQSATN